MSLKFYFPRVLLALTLSLGACSDSNDVDTPEPTPEPPAGVPSLSVAPASLTFKAEGETLELSVEAENVTWKAEAVDDWLTVAGGSGDGDATVKVTAAPNKTAAELTSSIVVTGKGVEPITVTVKQAAATEPAQPSLSVAPEALSFKAEGETLELTVTARDVNWTATCDAAWLTITAGSGDGERHRRREGRSQHRPDTAFDDDRLRRRRRRNGQRRRDAGREVRSPAKRSR